MANDSLKERIVIFIDGSNLYHIVRNLVPDKKPNDFDFEKFVKYLAGNRKMARVYYYNCPMDRRKNEESYIKQQKFFDKIQRLPNFTFVLCRMQKKRTNDKVIYEAKEDDIHLAVDMVKLAYNDAYDAAILVSSDGDFVPAIQAVKEKGKSVENIGFENKFSYHLQKICSKFIKLRKDVVEKFFVKMISREKALELVKKYNSDPADLIHFLESEAIMRALARKLGEDEEYWGLLGLLHDIDWGLTKGDSRTHLTKAPEILRENGFDEEFICIVVSHGCGWDCAGLLDRRRSVRIEFAPAASETITGLIHSYGLMRKTLYDMEVSGLKKKFKDKRFAAGVNREIILECEKLGLTLDEFLEISIKAVQSIAGEVGF